MEIPGAGSGPAAASMPRDLEAIANYEVSSDDGRYQSSFAGLQDTEIITLGTGHRPNHLRTISDGRINAHSHVIETPVISHATIGDGDLTIAFIERIAPGSINIPLSVGPNEVFFVGPGVEHTAVAMPGTRFDVTVFNTDDVRERAEEMGLHLGAVDRPSISRLAPTPAIVTQRRVLADLFQRPADTVLPQWMLDELLTSATTALAEASQERPRPPRAIINSRDVVARCLDYSRDLHRRPLMHELCRAAGVSERMVRKAFVDTFDLPPSMYFSHRALSRAHRLLAHGGAEEDTVTAIALEAGFDHVSRFAGRYRDVYGEPPSQTLRRRYTQWSTP